MTIPEGWKLVPKEPTREMCDAGGSEFFAGVNNHEPGTPTDRPFRRYYKAMLAASPEPPRSLTTKDVQASDAGKSGDDKP